MRRRRRRSIRNLLIFQWRDMKPQKKKDGLWRMKSAMPMSLRWKKNPSPAPAKQQKRDEKGVKQRRSAAGDISMAASVWQVTLFDLDKQLNRQRALMERMADDIKHLRKQLNQVQRDLAKFQKRMEKIGTTSLSKAKRGKRRG
jgi:uncharacterized coiled-coil protein SlyX